MKFCIAILVSFLIAAPSLAQTKDSSGQVADALEKLFTWQIEKAEKGKLMFLDVPYQHGDSDTTEFLTLTVAKDSSKLRPAFISVIVPGNVSHAEGIFIKFAKTVVNNGQQSIQLEDADPVHVDFENCDEGICTARMADGLATNDVGTREDIFRKFISFDHVFFLFMYPDGSHKSVAVPLFSFQQQYPKL